MIGGIAPEAQTAGYWTKPAISKPITREMIDDLFERAKQEVLEPPRRPMVNADTPQVAVMLMQAGFNVLVHPSIWDETVVALKEAGLWQQ